MRKAFGAVLLLNFTLLTLLVGCTQIVCPNPDKEAEYAWIRCDLVEPGTDAGADADADADADGDDAGDATDPDAGDDAGLDGGADGG